MINHTRNYLFLLFFISSIFANFGKNIVQYDEFNWSFIQTKHFNIYYYNLNKDQAELAAYNSEKAYKKIEKLLGWGLSKRSDIFVYSSYIYSAIRILLYLFHFSFYSISIFIPFLCFIPFLIYV